MKHVLVIVLSIGALALPAFAEDVVPYAYRPLVDHRQSWRASGGLPGSAPRIDLPGISTALKPSWHKADANIS